MKKIRVLQIVPSLSQANGVASYSINYYKNIKNIEIDFALTNLNTKSEYYNLIKKNGNKIIDLTKENSKNIFDYIRKIRNFFKENSTNYDIVHCNVANSGVFFLYYAKKYGIKTRIIHSHGTSTGDTIFSKMRNNIILPFTKLCANEYFACSLAAGKSMFKKQNFIVVNNAIDEDKYKYNLRYREEVRKEFNVDTKIVIGNIGRLANQKNQKFLLEILNLLKYNENFVLIIVGNGPLEISLKQLAKDYKIEKQVIFAGSRADTYKIYNAFDLLVLPSLYEGLPVVGIEAQCNGLPCIFSDTITKEVKINDNVYFLPITDANMWKSEIERMKFERVENNFFYESEYNIKTEAKKLELLYKKISSKR